MSGEYAFDWEAVAFDVARNHVGQKLPVDDLLPHLGIARHEFEELCEDALFKRKVRDYTKELTENGTSFALKAQIQAEDLLRTQYRIAKDPETPPSVAIAAIANTVRWAGLEKKASEGAFEQSGGPKISININLGAATLTKKEPEPKLVIHGDYDGD